MQSPFPQPDAFKGPALRKTPASQRELASVGTRRGAADSPQRKLLPTSVSFSSAFLDLLIGLALAMVFMVALLVVQIALGIATLLLVVPLPLAAAHQAGAVLVFAGALNASHALRR